MAADSFANAIAEMYALITSGGNPSGVSSTYDHEPEPGNLHRQPCVCTVSNGGMNPDFYMVAVRLYADASIDAKLAHDNITAAMESVDAKTNNGRWGPSNWPAPIFHPELEGTLVTEWLVERGREDAGGHLI